MTKSSQPTTPNTKATSTTHDHSQRWNREGRQRLRRAVVTWSARWYRRCWIRPVRRHILLRAQLTRAIQHQWASQVMRWKSSHLVLNRMWRNSNRRSVNNKSFLRKSSYSRYCKIMTTGRRSRWRSSMRWSLRTVSLRRRGTSLTRNRMRKRWDSRRSSSPKIECRHLPMMTINLHRKLRRYRIWYLCPIRPWRRWTRRNMLFSGRSSKGRWRRLKGKVKLRVKFKAKVRTKVRKRLRRK